MSAARDNWMRWLKFNLVGAIGIVIQLALLVFLHRGFALNYLLATALAVEATILHNFIWHETFTWHDRQTTSRSTRLIKFNVTTGAFSIAGNVIFTKLLVDFGLGYLSANALAIALCSIINFLLNDRLVFVGVSRTE